MSIFFSEMKIEISEQILLNTSKKHLSRNYDEENENFKGNFGSSLIPENFTLSSRLKDDRHMEPISEYLQYYSQPFTNMFNDADTLRHVSNVQSLLPTSLIRTSPKKIQESDINTKSGEINISTDRMKFPETTISKHSEILVKMLPTMDSQQLKVTTDKRQYGQEFVEEENLGNTLKELRNSSTRSSQMTPIKSILHMSSRKNRLRKKVRFPTEWSGVSALEHRLLINDLNLT